MFIVKLTYQKVFIGSFYLISFCRLAGNSLISINFKKSSTHDIKIMANRNGIASADDRLVNVTSQSFSASYSSKSEVHYFLSTIVGCYIDSYKNVSVYFLRDLLASKRKKLLSKDVKQISVPFFDNLSIAHMLEWAKRYPEVYQVLPADEAEIKNLRR